MWWLLAIVSALFLGIYDVVKKVSVNNNAVLPVLLFSSISGAILFIPILFLSQQGIISQDHTLYVPSVTWQEHAQLFLKAVIVVTSWIFSFFALKYLPLTIVAPIRATGPLWTLVGAILIFKEQLSIYQWIGIAITLTFFFLFSTAGKTEGISFKKNKWIWFIILGTVFGAISGLYDKFLLRSINRMAVQCYFTFYQVVLFIPLVMTLWWPIRKKSSSFKWRWSIPLIGIFLLVADFFYFYALQDPESMISIVSALRRGSVIVAFAFGAYLFKERNIRTKSIYLAGILLGIAFLIFGTK